MESDREKIHKWPVRPTASSSFHGEHGCFILGQVEVQEHWARKCPLNNDSLTTTQARKHGKHCPCCLLDPDLDPAVRMTPSKSALDHFWTQ